MSLSQICLLVLLSICCSLAQYFPPDAIVEPIKPAGIRISIPDEEGISLVAYHIRINEEFYALEAGTIAVDIIKKKNGRWVYEDRSTRLKEGDIVYYWVHVIYNGLGYNLLDQSHVVTDFYNSKGELVPPGSGNNGGGGGSNGGGNGSNNGGGQNKPCPFSATKIYDDKGAARNACAGQLLLQEDFKSTANFEKNKWTIVEQYSGAPDYEFVVYRNNPVNVQINNGLKLTPKLLQAEYGENFVRNGQLTLDKCTGRPETSDCFRQARGWNILPPITSGRINTKKGLNFQYGRVEIRAKFPRGDWIYPVITLESSLPAENTPLSTMQIRIASSTGNTNLRTTDGRDMSGNILWGGVSGLTRMPTEDNVGTIYNSELWSNEYHTYEIVWTADKITLRVDGQSFFNREVYNLPRDTPFHLSLGVAVGGVAEFPDNCVNRNQPKTWRNIEAKASYHFYNSIQTWYDSWQEGSNALDVEYVKVFAL